jgi:tetratricopeptide (TPR) repeat protein
MRLSRPPISLAAAITVMIWITGCAAPPESTIQLSDYQTVEKDARHDSDTAGQKNEQALAEYEKGDLAAAEQTARQALAADVTFGPAHNTLGMIYYRQSQLYLAAWEFQYAIKLMPRLAQAHANLGLVYEAGGQWDQAIDAYNDALRLSPDNEEISANLARARLRRGDRGDDVRQLLNQVASRDDRPEWTQWARQQLSRLRPPSTDPAGE